MKDFGYQVEHIESPDVRGIDVALLYKSKVLDVTNTENIRIDFPKEIVEDYTTRDLLVVEATLCNKTKTAFIVNHWPSRRGGLEASEPKRTYVAEQVRKAAVNLQNTGNEIIIMGDFNDEPHNNSIAKTLGAGCSVKKTPSTLQNCMCQLDRIGAGTYNYRGNWNMLDQVIVSNTIFEKGGTLDFQSATVFHEDWMLYQDKKNGPKPNRSYGGPNYYGGYSDHLPVYVDFVMR